MHYNREVYKRDLLYPELSYEIIGILFDISNEMGYGYKEKQYQKAIELGFKIAGLKCEKELPVRIEYKGKYITTVYLDFLVEDKVIVELKQGNKFYKKDVQQVYNYLVSADLKLGILARFTKDGVRFMRIVNEN